MTISEGLNEDFRDVLVELADAGVDFLIVGAFALAFHGKSHPRPDLARRAVRSPRKRLI